MTDSRVGRWALLPQVNLFKNADPNSYESDLLRTLKQLDYSFVVYAKDTQFILVISELGLDGITPEITNVRTFPKDSQNNVNRARVVRYLWEYFIV